MITPLQAVEALEAAIDAHPAFTRLPHHYASVTFSRNGWWCSCQVKRKGNRRRRPDEIRWSSNDLEEMVESIEDNLDLWAEVLKFKPKVIYGS